MYLIIRLFFLLLITSLISAQMALGQAGKIKGRVFSKGKPIQFATIGIIGTNFGTSTQADGAFVLDNVPAGSYKLRVSCIGFVTFTQSISLKNNQILNLTISLQENESQLQEVVISGTMKESFKSQSPVPIEVITSKYFLKNPSPSLFEAMTMVNGVQPQLNCNVCNTGDIHINGMEGPYTMITLDGMPIVSGLSTVYGLSGIPNSMVQRIEVVKGPASTLYGSEAVGGLINIITKSPRSIPGFSVDLFGTSNFEFNNDIALKAQAGKTTAMIGINYFNFKNRMDKNQDNFTDVTLQDRISIFNKWTLQRNEGREASLAARYVYEDRWGGEMQWNSKLRGGDSIYGESIYTNRYELIGKYDLPINEKISVNFSYTNHHQNSAYGATAFIGQQNIAFVQLLWNKSLGKNHSLLTGLPFRYTFYDDNTVGTSLGDSISYVNKPQRTFLPGMFVQDEIKLSNHLTTLIGGRMDYNSDHGRILSPRLSFKYSFNDSHVIRLGGGNGYRVVNLFTEDHAALTGSRKVIIEEKLKPEQSYNVNLNYTGFLNHRLGFTGIDFSIFYTYFTNKIIGNYTQNDTILYTNLKGYAVSKGISLNLDFQFMFPLKIQAGATYMKVFSIIDENKVMVKRHQLHAPNFSGTFTVTYSLQRLGITLDYTGKFTGPMFLPTLPGRPTQSPWYTLQNIQITKKVKEKVELYSGVKNIFNFVPKDPIYNPSQPFSQDFDTTYNYAPVLGARAFLGIRYTLF